MIALCLQGRKNNDHIIQQNFTQQVCLLNIEKQRKKATYNVLNVTRQNLKQAVVISTSASTRQKVAL